MPAGSSRTLTFEFPGTATLHDSTATAKLVVRAKGVLYGPRHASSGQTIALRGALAGGPFPADGVLGEIEVKYFGQWTQFSSIRSSSRGEWTFHYRLNHTPPSWHTPYPFRILILPQTGYPYRKAYTNTVRVKIN